MKSPVRPLLILHRDAVFRDRVRVFVRGSYGFQAVEDWAALSEALREAPPSAVAIVDPYFGSVAGEVSENIRALSVDFPSIPVLAALRVGPEDALAIIRLGRYGVTDVISIGHDDTRVAVLHRLDRAEGRPLMLLIEATLPRDVTSRARAIIVAATHVVSAGGHGRDLASRLDVSRRTLLRWCEAAGLPAPRRLLAWMRVLLAAELLDDPGRSVEAVAQACGYSADTGLRRVTLGFTGLNPTDLRARGALARASKIFVEELAQLRERVARAA